MKSGSGKFLLLLLAGAVSACVLTGCGEKRSAGDADDLIVDMNPEPVTDLEQESENGGFEGLSEALSESAPIVEEEIET